jgi:antitoxin MazE
MEANIITVGNSKGIIIPSKFLKLISLGNKVSIEVENNKIVIESSKQDVRYKWNELFKKADSLNDKDILIPDVLVDKTFEDWVW